MNRLVFVELREPSPPKAFTGAVALPPSRILANGVPAAPSQGSAGVLPLREVCLFPVLSFVLSIKYNTSPQFFKMVLNIFHLPVE